MDAYDAYNDWGAKAKVTELERQNPWLMDR